MKQLKTKRFLPIFAIILLFKLARSDPEWGITEDGTKYLVESKHEYTWMEALQECAKRNLSLVAIDEAEKNLQLVNLLKNRFGIGVDFWIGGSESTAEKSERRFVWTSTGKAFNFANWEIGEPNNLGGNQPCAHIWSKTNNFTWADGQWHLKYGYICEETFVSNYLQTMDKKRQVVTELFDKLIFYFKKKQKQSDQPNESQKELSQQIYTDLEDKLERAKLFIDRILEEMYIH